MRVAEVVDAIVVSLAKIDPESYDLYANNASDYKIVLNKLDEEIAGIIKSVPLSNRKIMTEHESLIYLTERYGMESIESVIPKNRSDVGPTPLDLKRAIEAVRKHNLKVIFIEYETNKAAAERVAEETGVKLSEALKVETLDENQSYEEFMRKNVNIIVSTVLD